MHNQASRHRFYILLAAKSQNPILRSLKLTVRGLVQIQGMINVKMVRVYRCKNYVDLCRSVYIESYRDVSKVRVMQTWNLPNYMYLNIDYY